LAPEPPAAVKGASCDAIAWSRGLARSVVVVASESAAESDSDGLVVAIDRVSRLVAPMWIGRAVTAVGRAWTSPAGRVSKVAMKESFAFELRASDGQMYDGVPGALVHVEAVRGARFVCPVDFEVLSIDAVALDPLETRSAAPRPGDVLEGGGGRRATVLRVDPSRWAFTGVVQCERAAPLRVGDTIGHRLRVRRLQPHAVEGASLYSCGHASSAYVPRPGDAVRLATPAARRALRVVARTLVEFPGTLTAVLVPREPEAVRALRARVSADALVECPTAAPPDAGPVRSRTAARAALVYAAFEQQPPRLGVDAAAWAWFGGGDGAGAVGPHPGGSIERHDLRSAEGVARLQARLRACGGLVGVSREGGAPVLSADAAGDAAIQRARAELAAAVREGGRPTLVWIPPTFVTFEHHRVTGECVYDVEGTLVRAKGALGKASRRPRLAKRRRDASGLPRRLIASFPFASVRDVVSDSPLCRAMLRMDWEREDPSPLVRGVFDSIGGAPVDDAPPPTTRGVSEAATPREGEGGDARPRKRRSVMRCNVVPKGAAGKMAAAAAADAGADWLRELTRVPNALDVKYAVA